VDTSTFNNLMNIITGSRDAFTMRQKELLDLKREHDNLLTTFPANVFLQGRPHIDVMVVTSARATEAFTTGQDNNVSLR
jgi:hypothetical protein